MAICDIFWTLFFASALLKTAAKKRNLATALNKNRSEAILCYQCNSTQIHSQFQCGEFFEADDLLPTSCDNVYGAKYCVKQIGHIEVVAIKCYQCYAAFNISCTDTLIHDDDIQPTDCDHVFEAAYCVKTTGLYAGGVGTRRFCSSSDLGSYCNYVRQPGDTLPDYRSCFYTCDTDGCNSGNFITPVAATVIAISILSKIMF